jgi:endoglucanase
MKEALKKAIAELTSLDGPPGFEQPVVEYLADQFESTGAAVSVDPMGNLYAQIGEQNSGPHLMIAAHSDEIAGIVRRIDDNGFIWIDPIGGLVASHLTAQRVRVAGHLGVVGVRPGHLQSPEERLRVPPIEEVFIDIGASSANDVSDQGIRIGSTVTYYSPLLSFTNSDRATGKAIDNRLGCAVLLQLFRELQGQTISGRLTGLVAVQEEVGGRGAEVGTFRVEPTYAIVVDTFPVGDTPNVPHGRMPGAIGLGPVLVAAASGRTVRGHIAHPKVHAWLEIAANRAGVAIQLATSIGWAVTDAATVHISRVGVPTAVVGLPRRYSHSPVCVFDINDSIATVRLLEKFVTHMSEHTDLGFL